MMKQIGSKDMDGKTIKASASSCELMIIVFTDNTFVQLKARTDYDISTIDDAPFQMFEFDSAELINIGLLTREELEQARKAKQQEDKEREEAIQRREYEALKKKFG